MTTIHSHQAPSRATSMPLGGFTAQVRRRPAAPVATDPARLTRYRGGTFSHTVESIVFADGSSARTDLIRVHPNVAAYSLDFTARAPAHPSRYQVQTWSALTNLRAHAVEVEVDWILRNSYPALGVAQLSARLRAAGWLSGWADLAEHEAIAATQAAIWHFTNGLQLDTRPVDTPVSRRDSGEGLVVEFAEPIELGRVSARVEGIGSARVELDRSVDGRDWRPVHGAAALLTDDLRHVAITLGVGATVACAPAGRRARGHRFYRLRVLGEAGPGDVRDLRFRLQGSRRFRNAARVVQLYRYLVDGAAAIRAATRPARIVAEPGISDWPAASVGPGELIGPLRFEGSTPARLSAQGARLVGADGRALSEVVVPATRFYLRPDIPATAARPGGVRSPVVVRITLAHGPTGSGRVATGVAWDPSSRRLTPLALALPVAATHEFEISWSPSARHPRPTFPAFPGRVTGAAT